MGTCGAGPFSNTPKLWADVTPPPGFHRPSGLLHSEWGAPPIRSPRSASQASGGRSRCEAFASAPASTRGQSGGHCTGGPAPGAERGARPGEGVGERRLQARRRELSAETCQMPCKRQSALAPRGPARARDGKSQERWRLRPSRALAPHPSSPHNPRTPAPKI